MGMASAIRRVMQQHHGSQRRRHLKWSAAGQFNTDSRTLIPAAQPQIHDFEDWGFSSAIMKPEGLLYHPRAGIHVGVGVRSISQLIATKGSHRLFLVDTLALVRLALSLSLFAGLSLPAIRIHFMILFYLSSMSLILLMLRLLPYGTRVCKVDIFVRLQMYQKKPR